MKKTFLIVTLLFTSLTIFNQTQQIRFDEITHKEGINSLQINAAITAFQDHQGFIWLSGGNGLQRYDGYEMVDYSGQIGTLFNEKIMEDSRGLLWISSSDGIHIFNPENEKMSYYFPDSTYKRITKVIEDKNGTIWCASYGLGLIQMEPLMKDGNQLQDMIFKKGLKVAFKISTFQINKDAISRVANNLYDLVEDSDGRLWIGSCKGLYVFNKETREFLRVDEDSEQHSRLLNDTVYAIAAESSDILWVLTWKGFNRISNIHEAFSAVFPDKAILDFQEYKYLVEENDLFNKAILIDHLKNFWFGNPAPGLTRINIDLNNGMELKEEYPDLYEKSKAEFRSVTSIMKDRTGLIWLGHSYPVIRKFRPEISPFTPMEGLLQEYPHLGYDFNQIYEDGDKNLWICTWGNGVFKISPSGKVTNYNLFDPAYPDEVGSFTVCILEIEKGIFWISTWSGIRQLDTNTGKCRKLFSQDPFFAYGVTKLFRCEDLIIIHAYGTIGNDLRYFNPRTEKVTNPFHQFNKTAGLKSNDIRTGILSRYGHIWLITDSFQIAKSTINNETDELVFTLLPDSVTRCFQKVLKEFKDCDIVDEDSEGNLWLYDKLKNVLIVLVIKSGKVWKWTAKEGLYRSSLNQILSVLEDNHGNIWLENSYTLSLLDKKRGSIRSFDKSDGLPEVRHTSFCSLKDSRGNLYFGGMKGFYRVDPDKLYENTVIPPIVVTEFRLFNQPVKIDSTRKAILTRNISYTRDINLKYNQHDLSFTFAALDYNNPAKNRYAYILEGYQKEWIETGADNRIASFTNLKPGKYVLRVKGSNNDGVWNEEGTFINIIIHPPFWKTTLAYIAYAVLFLLLLRGYIFWRTKSLRKEKLVLEKKVNERTTELKTANTRLEEHQKEIEEVNTLLEEQKEELMQQREELQSTLENLQKAQEQLIESEKMAAVGGLVAGVAHEMNTPLGVGITAISNLLDDVQKMTGLYEKDEISRKDFKEFLDSTNDTAKLIHKNLERAASLVQSFKQVSTDQVTEQQRVFDFQEYLNDILMSLRPKFRGKNIDIRINCDEKLKLNSYPGIYAQIFTNLLLNSLQHGFPEKDTGTIGIQVEPDKGMLKIRYTDDGAGISKKDLPHIFEPFYTSDQHRGTGLGLNIVYNLIRQKLHGTITCESEHGKGVVFAIEVPIQ